VSQLTSVYVLQATTQRHFNVAMLFQHWKEVVYLLGYW